MFLLFKNIFNNISLSSFSFSIDLIFIFLPCIIFSSEKSLSSSTSIRISFGSKNWKWLLILPFIVCLIIAKESLNKNGLVQIALSSNKIMIIC